MAPLPSSSSLPKVSFRKVAYSEYALQSFHGSPSHSPAPPICTSAAWDLAAANPSGGGGGEDHSTSTPLSHPPTRPRPRTATLDGQSLSLGYISSTPFVLPSCYIRYVEPLESELKNQVEYDMDEQDLAWLEGINRERVQVGQDPVSCQLLEVAMDRFEKEWFDLMRRVPIKARPGIGSNQTSSSARKGRDRRQSQLGSDSDDEDGKEEEEEEEDRCAICDDGEGENSNAIVFCDGCNLAVHQDCYGIPYIPEGQWLCRKCTVSPDRAVSCLFCPHEGGAFKQTSQGKWAHLLCAMWIPETGVANPVYMEPIDSVERIPKARWKLQCYLCKIKMGACIQCENRSCFTAFHVTCARKAGLLIKATRQRVKKDAGSGGDDRASGSAPDQVMTMQQPDPYGYKHEPEEEEWVEALHACCHRHLKQDAEVLGGGKPGALFFRNEQQAGGERDYSRSSTPIIFPASMAAAAVAGGSSSTGKKKIIIKKAGVTLSVDKQKQQQKKAHKLSKSARAYKQSYSVGPPQVPRYIVQRVLDYIKKFKALNKRDLILLIAKYWSLKREARRGAPLLKRLHLEPWTASARPRQMNEKDKTRKMGLLLRMREDLEKLRTLAELVRKREREKMRQARLVHKTLVGRVLFPYHGELREALQKIKAMDRTELFANPVDAAEVPDYYDIIREPMDWTAIANKCDRFEYRSVHQFCYDVRLVTSNATIYNRADTTFHKTAVKIRKAAEPILEQLVQRLGEEHQLTEVVPIQPAAAGEPLKKADDAIAPTTAAPAAEREAKPQDASTSNVVAVAAPSSSVLSPATSAPSLPLPTEVAAKLQQHLDELHLEPGQKLVDLLEEYNDDEMLQTIGENEDAAGAPSGLVENLMRIYYRVERPPTPPMTAAQRKKHESDMRRKQMSETMKRVQAEKREREAQKKREEEMTALTSGESPQKTSEVKRWIGSRSQQSPAAARSMIAIPSSAASRRRVASDQFVRRSSRRTEPDSESASPAPVEAAFASFSAARSSPPPRKRARSEAERPEQVKRRKSVEPAASTSHRSSEPSASTSRSRGSTSRRKSVEPAASASAGASASGTEKKGKSGMKKPSKWVGFAQVIVSADDDRPPKSLEAEDVNDYDSFKRFETGWILPPGQKRGRKPSSVFAGSNDIPEALRKTAPNPKKRANRSVELARATEVSTDFYVPKRTKSRNAASAENAVSGPSSTSAPTQASTASAETSAPPAKASVIAAGSTMEMSSELSSLSPTTGEEDEGLGSVSETEDEVVSDSDGEESEKEEEDDEDYAAGEEGQQVGNQEAREADAAEEEDVQNALVVDSLIHSNADDTESAETGADDSILTERVTRASRASTAAAEEGKQAGARTSWNPLTSASSADLADAPSASTRTNVSSGGLTREARLAQIKAAKARKETERAAQKEADAVAVDKVRVKELKQAGVRNQLGSGAGSAAGGKVGKKGKPLVVGDPPKEEQLKPGALVWAKWAAKVLMYFPAEIYDPKDELVPDNVARDAPLQGPGPKKFLVRWFDDETTRSWSWLTLEKLRLMFTNDERDESMLQIRHSKAQIHKAYERAKREHDRHDHRVSPSAAAGGSTGDERVR